jgi:hypothetical protein
MNSIETTDGLTTEEQRDLASMLPSGRCSYRTIRVGGHHFARWPDGLMTLNGRFARIDGAPLTAEDTVLVRALYELLKLNRIGEQAA